MSLLHTLCTRLRHAFLILVLCALGCVDDLDLADYPGAVCHEPQQTIVHLPIEGGVTENYFDEHAHRVVEGDILVSGSSASTGLAKSNVSVGLRLWSFGIVPYTVDSAVPELVRRNFEVAITEFEARTNLRFVTRDAANESMYPNYVRVVLVENEHIGGRSFVGMIGGAQDLELTIRANGRTALHELGHAVGLLHEHQRHDRDQYVTIHEDNFDPEIREWLSNIDDYGMDVGDYDFASVMHYTAYNEQGQWVLEPKVKRASSCSIGAAWRLSPGDLAGISQLYPDLNLGKHGDLNGDGTRDFISRLPGGATFSLLSEEGHETRRGGISPGGTRDWYLIGTGDFGGDGIDDLLWALPDGGLRIYDVGKATLDAGALVGSTHTPKQGFHVVAIDDFDGNGKHELLTTNDVGRFAIVIPETNQEVELPSLPANWRVAATGDLDGDAKADIVWSPATGQAAVWFMYGAEAISTTEPASHESGWWIAGIDDFDGDGRNDIVWTSARGGVAMWWNDGGPIGVTETRQLRGPGAFAIAGTGDFNGDGIADLRWANDQGSIGLQLFSAVRSSVPRVVALPQDGFSRVRLLN